MTSPPAPGDGAAVFPRKRVAPWAICAQTATPESLGASGLGASGCLARGAALLARERVAVDAELEQEVGRSAGAGAGGRSGADVVVAARRRRVAGAQAGGL